MVQSTSRTNRKWTEVAHLPKCQEKEIVLMRVRLDNKKYIFLNNCLVI